MNFRIRSVPIETMEVGKTYLNLLSATSFNKDNRQLDILQGPGVLEFQYTPEAEWLPVEFTK